MAYSTESSVYSTTGMNSEIIQKLSEKNESQVTTLIDGYISKAQKKIQEDIHYPLVIDEELHLGDGNRNRFKLGPQDEDFLTLGDYDPTDNLIKVYGAIFSSQRKWKPWPDDCDEWTNGSASSWAGTNVTASDETTHKVAGDDGIKMVFSAAGNAYYPSTKDLDKIIDTYADLFFWIKASSTSVTITVRLYETGGSYEEETITLRQANVGQYYWIDIEEMTDTLLWDNVYLQYIEFRVDGACTIYIDNLCFADSWAFTAPEGLFHVSVADNIASESAPSENYQFYVTFSYDPFLASTPANIAEACDWLVGVYIIDYLRGIRYRQTGFELFADDLQVDIDESVEGGKKILGIRTWMMKNYWRCLSRWGGASYGVV